MKFKLYVVTFLVVYPVYVYGITKIFSGIFNCSSVQIEDTCPNTNVTFWLYTASISAYQLLETDLSTIEQAPFIPDQQIVFLIHGWTGDKDYSPNLQIRPKLLQKGYNVISVDYQSVAPNPCYRQAVKNSKVVARCLAEFIRLLLTSKITNRMIRIEDLHLIGFSLGGQVAGKAGKCLKNSGILLPRITGLDVAGPLFYGGSSYLNQQCAEFVDSIHTCSGRLGKLLPIGDIDFYVDGIFCQRGCDFWNASCHHCRAPEVYAESIDSEIGFFGVNICGDIEIMGHNTPPNARGIYHVKTNSKPPYAKGLLNNN